MFPLSERFGAWRVIARDRTWQSDITPARGTIEEDLALRDFTVNAMAVPAARPGRLLDPARRRGGPATRAGSAAVGPRAFADDPLRVLRMARFACDLDFEVDPRTSALAAAESARIGEVAPERSFYELRRLIAGPEPRRGIELMDSVGLVARAAPGARGAEGRRAEPLPPPRRLGPHARGARAASWT